MWGSRNLHGSYWDFSHSSLSSPSPHPPHFPPPPPSLPPTPHPQPPKIKVSGSLEGGEAVACRVHYHATYSEPSFFPPSPPPRGGVEFFPVSPPPLRHWWDPKQGGGGWVVPRPRGRGGSKWSRVGGVRPFQFD